MKSKWYLVLALGTLLACQSKQEKTNAVDQFIQSEISSGRLKGAHSVVFRNDSIVYDKWYGTRDEGSPMKGDELYFIQSMTKPIISVALMTLFEEGKFKLDDPVEKYLPEFADIKVIDDPYKPLAENSVHPAKSKMTIAQVLSHTGGMSHGISQVTYDKDIWNAAFDTSIHTIGDRVKKFAGMPIMYDPGTRWNYSFSPDVASRLIEVLSGTTTEDYLNRKIFEPLGMKDTYYNIPAEKLNRIMTVYDFMPDTSLIRAKAQPNATGNTVFAGVNALFSSTQDYLTFAKMLLNGGTYNGKQIIKKETLELMKTDISSDLMPTDPATYTPLATGIGSDKAGNLVLEPGYGFGLGFAMLKDASKAGRPEKATGEFFWSGANCTYFFVNPSQNLTAVFMTQIGFLPNPNPYHFYYGDQWRKVVYEEFVQ